MLRLDQIKLNLDQGEDVLRARAARLLRLQPSELKSLQVLRRAVDAREGLSLVYTVAVEVADQARVLRRCLYDGKGASAGGGGAKHAQGADLLGVSLNKGDDLFVGSSGIDARA